MHSLENNPTRKRKNDSGDELKRILKKPRLKPLSPGLVPDKCYHVTFANNLDSIRREGLSPRFGGIGGASQGVPEMEKQSKGFIHMSKEKTNAVEYKLTLLAMDSSKKLILLRVNTNKNNWYNDPDDSGAIKTDSQIPIEDIKILISSNGNGKFVPLSKLDKYLEKPDTQYQFDN